MKEKNYAQEKINQQRSKDKKKNDTKKESAEGVEALVPTFWLRWLLHMNLLTPKQIIFY
jgi:hypothetical protein